MATVRAPAKGSVPLACLTPDDSPRAKADAEGERGLGDKDPRLVKPDRKLLCLSPKPGCVS